MSFEWDEAKRAANLEKHGVDFEFARLVFDGPTLEGPTTGVIMASRASALTAWPKVRCCS